MPDILQIASLTPHQIENIEKLTLRWLVQAVMDFGYEASGMFMYSPDKVQDVAEDVTWEIADRLSGYNMPQRILGTVDYKKARYIIFPDAIARQALFIDSKVDEYEYIYIFWKPGTTQVDRSRLQKDDWINWGGPCRMEHSIRSVKR